MHGKCVYERNCRQSDLDGRTKVFSPYFDIIEAIQNAERKFGITGLKGLLRGRFLQGLPPLGVLKMREPLDPAAIAEFFAAQARNWISDAIKGVS